MSATNPVRLPPEDKLDALRYLDEFHYWHSLDDERRCERCGRLITGRQILIVELQGTRGKLRLQCPTPGCVSTPSEWVYANPVRAAKLGGGGRSSGGGAKADSIANQRIHHGGGSQTRPGKRRRAARKEHSGATKHNSIFVRASSFRGALARLVLLRPLATALHSFRPIA